MTSSVNQRVVRIVFAGDPQTGKTSLVLRGPAFPHLFDGIPTVLIDTSCCLEDKDKLIEELKRADSIILTYACDRPRTLENLTTRWLPHLRELQVKVPVIVVGCKLDLRDENQTVSLEQLMSPLTQQFHEIEAWLECSVFRHNEVLEVLFCAQKAALYPMTPLFDRQSHTLMPRCRRALNRIFILCDHDKDGALSDAELNDFQVKCFNTPLEPHEIMDVKQVVQDRLSEGVNERGLTQTGFIYLHTLFIEKGPLETTWTVLRKFGYNNDIKLSDDLIPPLKRAPDQSVELTNKAIDFLKTIFDEFDGDSDKVLQPRELEELFSTVPDSPWIENPYRDAVERNAVEGLSLDAFLSEWALMTLLNPTVCMENLICMGYPGDPSSAISVTRRRHVDRKKQHSERNVFQCFIFGPMRAGKSALLDSFIGRPYSEAYNPTNEDRYAVNVVDISREKKKYLVLREISEDGVINLLANKTSLASCDIAVFIHDRSNESSRRASSELLLQIDGHGKDTSYQVPCLIVTAEEDRGSFTMAIQELTMVSQDMEETHMQISMELGEYNNIFRRIVTAAEHPHLSIPTIETRMLHKRLIVGSLMVVSVIALGVAVVFDARKNNARKNAARKIASDKARARTNFFGILKGFVQDKIKIFRG